MKYNILSILIDSKAALRSILQVSLEEFREVFSLVNSVRVRITALLQCLYPIVQVCLDHAMYPLSFLCFNQYLFRAQLEITLCIFAQIWYWPSASVPAVILALFTQAANPALALSL